MSPQAAPKPLEPEETPEKRALRLTRIKALIQQASSAEGDGQQAAVRACALIRKFGLDIVDPALMDHLYREIHTLKGQLEAVKAGDEFGRPAYAGSAFWGKTGSSSTVWPGTGPPPPQHTPPQAHVPPSTKGPGGSPMLAPAFIASSKFDGRCKQCGKSLNVGDPVRWLKNVGVWCATSSCYSDWLNLQNASAQFTSPFAP